MITNREAILEVHVPPYFHKGKRLLDEISFELRRGETFVLLGESGSGKSLLVEAIAGLLPIKRPVTRAPSIKKTEVVFSYDQFAAMSFLKVGEILRLYEVIYDTPRDRELIERLRLSPLMKRGFTVLSKGERRRVGLYAALFMRPRVAILDEPTDGLDPMLRDVFWEVLSEYAETRLVTTHIWDEAARHHDRLALLAEGRLLAPPMPLDELVAGTPFRGKVITDTDVAPPSAARKLLHDGRAYLYFTDDGMRDEIVSDIQGEGGTGLGYSIMPLDLKDIYLLKLHEQTSRSQGGTA